MTDMEKPPRRLGLALRLSLLTLAATGLIFSAAFLYNYRVSKNILLAAGRESAMNLTHFAQSKLEDLLNNVEPVALTVARAFAANRPDKVDPLALMRDFAENHPGVFGVCAAFEPEASPGGVLFAPYFSHQGGHVVYENLAKPGYDYLNMDWYALPKKLGRPVWSEPYFDEGGGNIIMATYSVPIYRGPQEQKQFTGIATTDISLTWLQEEVARLSILTTGFAFLISRGGTFVSHPEASKIMHQSIFGLAAFLSDPDLNQTGLAMIQGETGFSRLSPRFTGKPAFIAYAPLPSSGWSVGLVVPEDELFADLTQLHGEVVLIGAVGFASLLAVVALISAGIARPVALLAKKTQGIAKGNLDIDLPRLDRNDEIGDLAKAFEDMRQALKIYIADLTETTKAKQRMESELKIAKSIQMSFLPKRFPPFPDIPAFTLHAALIPAREVGGDLYDFFLLGKNKLFFSVGDVSGKGVPAALFMAVTKTLFKGIAEHESDPAEILFKVNQELSQENDTMLFVTIFCAILDFTTGELIYSNAGHNLPVFMPRDAEADFLPLPEGLILGIMEDTTFSTKRLMLRPGDTLLVYTDGVTEAQDADLTLYSNERFLALARTLSGLEPDAIDARVLEAVEKHAAGAPQADDITVLTIRYNGPQEGA